MHDGVFRQGKGICICNSVKDGGQLVLLLTIVEYLEVFIELGAERITGEAGKWLIVIVIQIFKSVLRFFLLFRSQLWYPVFSPYTALGSLDDFENKPVK